LLTLWSTPVVRLNRAIALREVAGPDAALAEVEAIAGDLDRYHLFHATRAELLRSVGSMDEARLADLRALEMTPNPAERWILQERMLDDPPSRVVPR